MLLPKEITGPLNEDESEVVRSFEPEYQPYLQNVLLLRIAKAMERTADAYEKAVEIMQERIK